MHYLRFATGFSALLLSGILLPVYATGTVAEPAIRAAVEKAIPLLEKGSGESTTKVKCFTCHNQAIPTFALSLARERGFTVNGDNLKKQVEVTLADLSSAREAYLKGQGQGGGVDRAGYALLTLERGQAKADDTTAAVTEYLLLKDQDGWKGNSNRPPSEASRFTTTALALRELRVFGTEAQQERITTRRAAARNWLLATTPGDTEDRAFRLMALKEAEATAGAMATAIVALRKSQREDGGWAQLDGMESDAYATGSVLTALRTAGVPAADPDYRRGVDYLLKTQLPDGSWYVKSRSKPFQPYYESGFPHGKDQFISIAASSWATAALVLALPTGKDGR